MISDYINQSYLLYSIKHKIGTKYSFIKLN